MPSRDRSSKLQNMEDSYSRKRDGVPVGELSDFHHRHIVLFMKSFSALMAHYKTPSSSLLNNDLFLAVEAASNVARRDIGTCAVPEQCDSLASCFATYFPEFETLKSGAVDLTTGVERCLRALTGGTQGGERERTGFRFTI
jgi:hypothetical protein